MFAHCFKLDFVQLMYMASYSFKLARLGIRCRDSCSPYRLEITDSVSKIHTFELRKKERNKLTVATQLYTQTKQLRKKSLKKIQA